MNHKPVVAPALRWILWICGTLSLVVGILGLLIPIFPTTPFLLVAAACYFRSSQKFYDWLLSRPYFGKRIRDYREGRGVGRREKMMMIALFWIMLGTSALLFVKSNRIRLVLASIAVLVTLFILRIKTKMEPDPGSREKT